MQVSELQRRADKVCGRNKQEYFAVTISHFFKERCSNCEVCLIVDLSDCSLIYRQSLRQKRQKRRLQTLMEKMK